MPSPVKSKRDFVPRFIAGEFGNRTPTWLQTPEGWPGELCFRGFDPGFRTVYNARGPQPPGCYVSDMVPKDVEAVSLLQGEVYRGTDGLTLWYSTERGLAMKPALERGKHAYRSGALALLNYALCPRSREWLEHLLDAYDGHVVEFSAYGREYGMVPGFNTLFWEVRNY